jgi:tetratricopeptide (TPR) repeat protein
VAKAVKKPDGPKRQPLASTCVAFGDYSVRAAADPKASPAQQEHLRDQARRAYQQALQVDPNYLPAYTALAHLYTTMGDEERAAATYQRALKSHPRDAKLWYELGMCHARYKKWESALAALQQATALDPENRQYVHTLGFCPARAGRYDESFRAFARVEDEATAHYNLARMLHHMKQDELCKQHLRLAVHANPDLAPARQLLASLEEPGTEVSQPITPTAAKTNGDAPPAAAEIPVEVPMPPGEGGK